MTAFRMGSPSSRSWRADSRRPKLDGLVSRALAPRVTPVTAGRDAVALCRVLLALSDVEDAMTDGKKTADGTQQPRGTDSPQDGSVLTDSELEKVSGGGALSNAIKSIGEAVASAAKQG